MISIGIRADVVFGLRGSSGGEIEGMPDLFLIEVGLDREALLKGIDPQLRAAIGYIEKDS